MLIFALLSLAMVTCNKIYIYVGTHTTLYIEKKEKRMNVSRLRFDKHTNARPGIKQK